MNTLRRIVERGGLLLSGGTLAALALSGCTSSDPSLKDSEQSAAPAPCKVEAAANGDRIIIKGTKIIGAGAIESVRYELSGPAGDEGFGENHSPDDVINLGKLNAPYTDGNNTYTISAKALIAHNGATREEACASKSLNLH